MHTGSDDIVFRTVWNITVESEAKMLYFKFTGLDRIRISYKKKDMYLLNFNLLSTVFGQVPLKNLLKNLSAYAET